MSNSFKFLFLALVPTATTGVVQRFKRFERVLSPGLNFFIPFIEDVSFVSNRLNNQSLAFETKTLDNVFVNIEIDIQHKISAERSEISFFSLENPGKQIGAFVGDTIRSSVAKLTVDDLFSSQHDLCNNVQTQLSTRMESFGHEIENVLITGIHPDKAVKDAMNKINASKRLFEASKNEADANYIKMVREAEGDAERKKQNGLGIANQRRAIIDGFRDGVLDMSKALNGMEYDKLIDFILKSQQLDSFEHLAKSPNAKTVFIPVDYSNRKSCKKSNSRLLEDFAYSNEITRDN